MEQTLSSAPSPALLGEVKSLQKLGQRSDRIDDRATFLRRDDGGPYVHASRGVRRDQREWQTCVVNQASTASGTSSMSPGQAMDLTVSQG
jgi:hypothetical protein